MIELVMYMYTFTVVDGYHTVDFEGLFLVEAFSPFGCTDSGVGTAQCGSSSLHLQ